MKLKDIFLYITIFVVIGLLFFWYQSRYLGFWQNQLTDGLELSVTRLTDDEGWRYSIYQGDRLLIRQEKLPLIQGNQRIPSEQIAQQLGTIVLQKLRKKKSPVIREEELTRVLRFDSKKDSIF
ncbi:MAG: DUF4907 domain-containing protein [Bacteroidota bacterium]|nr:DUF4907 domain-containing protein [uncultured Allomuricauda sp.]